MFRIGDFARMNHISVATLRYYDECSLLKPIHTDSETGYRYYDAEQMVILHRILAMKEAGMSLTEIHERFHAGYDQASLLGLLRIKEAELRAAVEAESERLGRLQNWIIAIQGEEIQNMSEVTIKKVEPLLVAGLRETIPNFEHVEDQWKELNEYIKENAGKIVIPCMMLYHGQETGPWDIEVIEPIAKPFHSSERVRVYELSSYQRVASMIHNGPFESIGQTYAAFSQWLETNGCNPIGPTREIYHKGDWMTDDPSEYITEIQYPIG